ncbi:alpha/beta hydrolase family protein [Legionella fallonii]|uniref:Putative hydrolase (Similar to SdbA protein, putative substrate of the Dot/Icm system) n=1 Tax=Legionella fallonii LLAP-10 TaxID=1212491 RepID=A0A098G3L9_9GAMM|nr:alpha/beta hydrolase [Legionella fallonii]CEG56080.1 putative hydrolase (similar to SdbA protein, putative substrate of the Dot/Icm system) [Legionella fallonii LLAP-10]
MRTHVPGYYILERPNKKSWFDSFKAPFTQLSQFLPSSLSRAFTIVALGPDEIRLQNPIHVMFTTDDRKEKGTVIVNMLPSKSQKAPKSYFDKKNPFSPVKRQKLLFDNPEHKSHVDSIIAEIGKLLDGSSTQDKCKEKQFAIEDIHLKGLERLDEKLADYFKEQIRQKYGQDFFERPRKTKLDFYTLEPSESVTLESVEVSNAEEQMKPMSERKFIIACMARNQNYIYWLKDFYISSQNIGCSVIGFNYRGVDYSKGMIKTQNDMVNDAIAQADRLLELGVKPENIAFEGMSLGGAIATISAATMHDKGLEVKLYNERSYRSLIRLMIGYIMPKSDSNPWNPLTWLKYIAVGLTYLFLAPIMWLEGWHLDAASAWDRIPMECKDYSVARNHTNPEQHDDDDLVHDSFSSIASLMAEHLEEVKQKQKDGVSLSKAEQQILDDKPESHEFSLNRDDKTNANESSHSAPRRFLLDTHTRSHTMQSYMIESMRTKLGTKPLTLDSSENPTEVCDLSIGVTA